ncbi:hypothetical protein RCG19_10745 [Neobacillus sp. OS1-2]|uniref:hypothetical protein n=1 Tax=Neobacillus sp. OS1-2 TaxID=3070680 RepID=UPI0027E0B6FD|nr:hypothetical protein [Neobacillus sp. OS1-2]WML42054.1 hypothetical protein RCG19_10745 [Neobacillus sp. OS1-2]
MTNIKLSIARYFEELISLKWLVLGVLIYFYGTVLKKRIVENAIFDGVNINGWDISLNLFNDMYMIVYFVVPLMLFFSTTTILDDFNHEILIRVGSMQKWVFRSLKRFWIKSSIFLLIWVFMCQFLTIGLPHSWSWSQFSNSNNLYNTLNEVVVIFSTPLTVFILQLVLFIFAISMLHVFLSLVYVTIKKINLLLIMCVILFIGGLVGFKLLPSEYAYLSPTTYFSITKYIHSFNPALKGLGILAVQIIVFTLYLLMIDLNKKRYFQSVKPYLSHLIYISLCLLGIISSSNNLGPTEGTILDVWVMSFRGTSSESFSYSSFFYYSIVFFGLVYLVNFDISKELDSLGFYKIIRFRSLKKWFWSWFRRILLRVIFLLLLFMILSVTVGLFTGREIQYKLTVFDAPLYTVFYHFLINGFLQIVVYILFVFIFSWTRKDASHGIVIMSIFMIIMLPGINQLGVIPVGLNSLVYLEYFSPLRITLVLLISSFVIYSVIKYLFTKSIKM